MLRAKDGEFMAYTNLTDRSKRSILPLLDIPKAKTGKNIDDHLSRVIGEVGSAFAGRSIFLDTFAWKADSVTESGEFLLPALVSSLEGLGVAVNPVVGYDRWTDLVYQQACATINLGPGRRFCLRFDREAVADMADPAYFGEQLSEILGMLGCSVGECYALVDLADVGKDAVDELIRLSQPAIASLYSLGFTGVILSGASIPASISDVIDKPDTNGYVMRREWVVWRTLLAQFPSLIFADYGVRSPRSNDTPAPHVNAKIRYTVGVNFYVERGHSMQLPPKGAQTYSLARKIIDSGHYNGPAFSWGDSQLALCAEGKFKGNSTQWIGIDTNHHIEAVVASVVELRIAAKSTVV